MSSNHEIFVRGYHMRNDTTVVCGDDSFIRSVAVAIKLHTEVLEAAANLLADQCCVLTHSACEHDCIDAIEDGCEGTDMFTCGLAVKLDCLGCLRL